MFYNKKVNIKNRKFYTKIKNDSKNKKLIERLRNKVKRIFQAKEQTKTEMEKRK